MYISPYFTFRYFAKMSYNEYKPKNFVEYIYYLLALRHYPRFRREMLKWVDDEIEWEHIVKQLQE